MIRGNVARAIFYLPGALRVGYLSSELLVVIVQVLVVIFFVVAVGLDYARTYSRLLIVILDVTVRVLSTIGADRLAHLFIALWDERLTARGEAALGGMLRAGLSPVGLGDV